MCLGNIEIIFWIFIAEGTYTLKIDFQLQFSPYQILHDELKVSVSIRCLGNAGTSGAILTNRMDFYALTCAHMFKGFETTCIGFQVAQPAYSDFVELLKSSQRHLQACQSRLQRAGEHLKARRQGDLENAEEFMLGLEAKEENDIGRYQTSMDIGVVVKSGYQTVEWNGQKCLLDYALYKIQRRQPDAGSTFNDVPPSQGHLSTLDWENNPIGHKDLSWDMYVKKCGRSTGVTYGTIAGVHAVMRVGGNESIQ
jgi:hypothetical protein